MFVTKLEYEINMFLCYITCTNVSKTDKIAIYIHDHYESTETLDTYNESVYLGQYLDYIAASEQ